MRLSPFLLLIVVWLSTYRVTHLLNTDRIMRWFRMRLRKRDDASLDDNDGWWDPETESIEQVGPRSYFITCPYCVSIYVAAIITTAVVLWPTNRAVIGVLVGLSASAVAANISTRES